MFKRSFIPEMMPLPSGTSWTRIQKQAPCFYICRTSFYVEHLWRLYDVLEHFFYTKGVTQSINYMCLSDMGNPLCSFFMRLLWYTSQRGMLLKNSDNEIVSVFARNMSHDSFLVPYFINNTILYLLSHVSAFAKLHRLFYIANWFK